MSRKRSVPTDTAATSKKFRSAIDDTVDEFLCPITQELPIDPVMAADGHVYERKAIEKWLQHNNSSPSTNLEMESKTLLPAVQVKSAIEKMVKSGAISGDKAEKWLKKIRDEERKKELLQRASTGDSEAMEHLGYGYSLGFDGFVEDVKQGAQWYERAAQHGSTSGLYLIGDTDLEHLNYNSADGVAFLVEAAERGHGAACLELASRYERGDSGLRKNMALAKRWMTRALKCEGSGWQEQAKKWLQKNSAVETTWHC